MVQGRHKYTSMVNSFQFDTTFEKYVLLSYKMVQSSLYVLLMPYSVLRYNVYSAVYVHCSFWCSLCVLRLLVQFMCTAVIGAAYVYCIDLCSLWVLHNFIQFMATVLCNAVYEYCVSDTIHG